MRTKTEYAFFFAAGLLAGIIVEPYILRRLTHSGSISAGTPKISVDEPTFNFGDRDAGDVVEHSFTVVNRGDAPLLIDRFLTSCGCTSADVTSKSVAPGGSVQVTMKLDLHLQRGQQHQTTVVQSNDPSSPNLKLTLVGNAVSHVTLSPPYIKFVPSEDGEPHTATIRVKADDSIEAFKIERAQTSGKDVQAEVQTIVPGRESVVTVKVIPQPKAADFEGWVRLETDHPGEYKQIAIPVLASQRDIAGKL